ncbi:MAG: ACT domain-containing protein [Chloroflexota bacterium]|nr:MAG: ACT domain-containing protein [Chloroflexota bacterium]
MESRPRAGQGGARGTSRPVGSSQPRREPELLRLAPREGCDGLAGPGEGTRIGHFSGLPRRANVRRPGSSQRRSLLMNAFIVELKNKPGQLARATESIAQKGINILGFSGATCGDSGSIVLLTNDEAATKRALGDAGFRPREVELVVASLANQPGSLATVARTLADAGVNIEAAVPTGMEGGNVSVAFATDNPSRARQVLGERVAVGAHR